MGASQGAELEREKTPHRNELLHIALESLGTTQFLLESELVLPAMTAHGSEVFLWGQMPQVNLKARAETRS